MGRYLGFTSGRCWFDSGGAGCSVARCWLATGTGHAMAERKSRYSEAGGKLASYLLRSPGGRARRVWAKSFSENWHRERPAVHSWAVELKGRLAGINVDKLTEFDVLEFPKTESPDF